MSELAPPRKSVELEDSGAHELEHSENESDVFSDAQEGRRSYSSGNNSPIPTTRVEKVDDTESHGEVPGTEAYRMRIQDAVPDELEIVPEGKGSRRNSAQLEPDRTATPGGTPIPRTVVEKVDPESPSHGDVPGTPAHAIRKADAVPDAIKSATGPATAPGGGQQSASSTETPVPRMVVTRIDSKPAHGEIPGTEAYEIRKGDAEPDVLERKADVPGLPTSSLSRSTSLAFGERRPSLEGTSPIAADGGFGPMSYDEDEDGSEKDMNQVEVEQTNTHEEESEFDEGFGDDFDDFEAGAGDDDFGDFDEGFQQASELQVEPKEVEQRRPSVPTPESPFPLIDFSSLSSLDDILETTSAHLDAIFPSTKDLAHSTPTSTPSETSNPNPIFLTPLSASLWAQLVAPPPLQPPNWVRSRIRRLFLVSLGVPVDLDEILPASKQKKLILPSTLGRNDSPSRASSDRNRRDGSRGARLKPENSSNVSLDQQVSGGVKSKRRKGPAPPPDLDPVATRQLCATTGTALDGFTDGELRAHVSRLEECTERAREVLEYWLRRKDGAMEDKETFERVIENLVRHARSTRRVKK
ncbi:MAG: hypothetical protein Q9195_000788 [Heterodermia aff. obscurata]